MPVTAKKSASIGSASEGFVKPAMEKCETYQLTSSRNKKLHARAWKPDTRIRGIVFICHGYSEHLGFYTQLALRLVEEKLACFGHDHVGHGLSEGQRGFFTDVSEPVDDFILHINMVAQQHDMKDLPIYIVGHSMGGMIAVSTALSCPLLSGVVLVGPLISLIPAQATPLKMAIIRVLSNLVPQCPVGRLKPAAITRDANNLRKIVADELFYTGAIKLGLADALGRQMDENKKKMGDFTLPLLILHGAEDALCALSGSQDMMKLVSSKDKTIKVFPDAYHSLYQELPEVREEAFNDTISWLKDRLPKQSY